MLLKAIISRLNINNMLNKKLIITIITCVVISFAALRGQDVQYAKKVVTLLASDSLKGRGYVDNGHLMAAGFISHEFETLGLVPLNRKYSRTFRQEVNTIQAVKLSLNDSLLVPGRDYLVEPYSPSLTGTFPVVQIKQGLLLSPQKLSEALKDVDGKVLVIDERDDTISSPELKKRADETLNVLKYNPQIPNVATLVLTDKKLTWSVASIQSAKPVFVVHEPAGADSLQQVAINLKAKLSTQKLVNLAGYIEGTVHPDTFLVLTAHYDHLGMMGEEAVFNGANDNASGVAMLLSLARYFADNPPAYSMVFVALAAEELGLLGAKSFVDDPPVKLQQVKFLVNFDLAGTGDEGIMVVNGSVFKDELLRLQEINEEKKYLEAVKVRGAACISDHCIFYQAGVPSFYIYTLGGISAYHDIYDRPETLPLTEFEDYARLMIDFAEGFK